VSGPLWLLRCRVTARVGVCVRGCAVRFKSAGIGKIATAAKASGYLFYVCRDAKTGKWFTKVSLRGVQVITRHHKHAWQAAADLEWQLARWCAHTGEPRSRYVSNAARLVELGRADAAGVLSEAVTVSPWDLSRSDGRRGKAAPAGERLCCACGAPVARHASLASTHCAADAASAASSDASSDSEEEEEAGDSDSESEEEAAAGGGGRRSASRAPAAPTRPPPPAARPAAAGAGAGAGRRAPAPPPPAPAAAAAPAPPRRRRLSRFAMSLRGLLPPVSDEVLAAAVWRLYGVSAFEPASRGVGRKRRRSEVAGGVGEEREGAAGGGGGGGGRRRVGS
jgi:hypothetical protein